MTTGQAFKPGTAVIFTDGDGQTQHGSIDHVEVGMIGGLTRYAVLYTMADGPAIVLREGHELRAA